jgi:DNA polymerase (family X)
MSSQTTPPTQPNSRTNAEVAAALRRLADLLEIKGETVFRVVSYRRAAESIEQMGESLAAIRERGDLRKIPGVGPAIADKIVDVLDTGTIRQLDRLQKEIPAGVAELLAVPDVGPKRAYQLYKQLGIDSLEALRAAVEAGRLTEMDGLGPKGAQRIADGLKAMQAPDDRLPLPVARRLGQALIAQLRERAPAVTRVELAGSLRRMRDTIGDLDIVAAAEDPAAVVEVFAGLPGIARIEMKGANRCRVQLESGVSADLRVLPERHWGNLLHHFTGGKYHNVHLRDLAIERGAKMSEYGYQMDGELVTCATEEEVYAFLGMELIPPPMRENTGEIELALKRQLPPVLQPGDLRGDVHAHSVWSDGTATIREMAEAARERGYEYLALTDHSQGLGVANGLTPERIARQGEEIDRLNAELAPFRILKGIEVEVRSDGDLDLPVETLAGLDLVIASVHSGLRQGRERVTERALAALRHPLVDILAHPTGRILGGRAGGDFDLDAIYAEAARTGTALEINGQRFDLRDVHARAAGAAGCTISIGSDAHSIGELDAALDAVGIAQRGWVPPVAVLNALSLPEMLGRLKRRRAG